MQLPDLIRELGAQVEAEMKCKPKRSKEAHRAVVDEHGAWLSTRAGRCPHLLARITPEQCAVLKSRPEVSSWADGLRTKEARPPYCAKCSGIKEAEKVEKSPRAASKAQEPNTGKPVEAKMQPEPSQEAQAILDVIDRRLAEGLSKSAPAPADPFGGLTFDTCIVQPSARMAEPALSITIGREISLNSSACAKLMGKGHTRVRLSVARDVEKLVLGMCPTAETGPGTYALSAQGGSTLSSRRASCAAALALAGVKPGQAGIKLAWSPTHAMWCAVVEREG